MGLLTTLADNRRDDSLATRLRRRRFALFRSLLDTVPRPCTVLDLGGTQQFWDLMCPEPLTGVHVTILNTYPRDVTRAGFDAVLGDARSMPQYADGQFDIVFSNSVIEHVGTWDDQARMAAEVRRVGKRFFVQTPNRWFPIEPHFLVPGFQFLPVSVRIWMVQRAALGWMPRLTDPALARQSVVEIQLLSPGQMRRLFAGAHMYAERFAGLTKSVVAYGGFD